MKMTTTYDVSLQSSTTPSDDDPTSTSSDLGTASTTRPDVTSTFESSSATVDPDSSTTSSSPSAPITASNDDFTTSTSVPTPVASDQSTTTALSSADPNTSDIQVVTSNGPDATSTVDSSTAISGIMSRATTNSLVATSVSNDSGELTSTSTYAE